MSGNMSVMLGNKLKRLASSGALARPMKVTPEEIRDVKRELTNGKCLSFNC